MITSFDGGRVSKFDKFNNLKQQICLFQDQEIEKSHILEREK